MGYGEGTSALVIVCALCITIACQVYLDSWKFVASHTSPAKAESEVSEAVAWLVSNWTNPDFVTFVDALEEIVNGYVPLNCIVFPFCELSFL